MPDHEVSERGKADGHFHLKPRSLRDSGKETTVVRDASFSTLVGRGLIQQLVEKG